jgi:hypothetical protein
MRSFEKTVKIKSIPTPFIIFLSTLCWLLPAKQDFDRCLTLNKSLRQSLERLIAETKQQIAGRNSIWMK